MDLSTGVLHHSRHQGQGASEILLGRIRNIQNFGRVQPLGVGRLLGIDHRRGVAHVNGFGEFPEMVQVDFERRIRIEIHTLVLKGKEPVSLRPDLVNARRRHVETEKSRDIGRAGNGGNTRCSHRPGIEGGDAHSAHGRAVLVHGPPVDRRCRSNRRREYRCQNNRISKQTCNAQGACHASSLDSNARPYPNAHSLCSILHGARHGARHGVS